MCYHDHVEFGMGRGYLGKLDSVNLYYEVWNESAPGGNSSSCLLLRTDTIAVPGQFNFCMDDQDDSIDVRLSTADSTIEFKTLNAKLIPTLFQVLIPHQYGSQQFWGLNSPGSDQKLYLKGDKLYLTYPNTPRYGTPGITSNMYQLNKGVFKLVKSTYKSLKGGK